MKLKAFLLFGLILVFNCSTFAQNTDWFIKIKSVEILKSNRENIEKTFGKPEESTSPYFVSYNLSDGKMRVRYSERMCDEQIQEGWNVPEFTVTLISFSPKQKITPKQLKIKSADFRKYENSHVTGAFNYENDESGISFSVKTTGEIEVVAFYPQKKYDSLQCKR